MTDIKKILESYKISTSPHEIMEILTKAEELSQPLMWQTHPDHRTIFKVSDFNLDAINRKLKITYDSSSQLIDPKLPVYLKVPFRETIFKGNAIQFKQNEVYLAVPTEVRMREFRATLRTNFKMGEKSAFLRPSMAGVVQNKLSTLKVYLKDVSQKGLAIFVSENNLHLFRKGQVLELMGFDQHDLATPLLCQVVYNRKTGQKEQRLFGIRIGIKMINLIPEAALHKISARKKRSVSDELLSSDILSGEFRDMLSFEVSKTVDKMKKRPAIAKYLKELEIAKGTDDYLADHIDALTIICTFIARSMNWVSEASVEKFVYASFMHDAPFFKYPRLAQIKNMKDFKAIQPQLSSVEIALYLNAPETAAEMAMSDPAAPPDVSQMLLLQKELPNGEGFYKKTVSKISPMAALFIVAHDLTDEIMRNPDWDIENWLKSAKLIYQGGPFNKILQALEDTKVTLKNRVLLTGRY